MINGVHIRTATPSDAADLLAIYSPYILDTAVTFETVVPTVEEFAERIRNITPRYPYLAAIQNGGVIGYVYAHEFSERGAYIHSAELSIYLKPEAHGHGLGKHLIDLLEHILAAQNVTNLYSRVASPEHEDEYLTYASRNFHSRLGFNLVGMLNKCGYKFGKWYNMCYFEKIIREHSDPSYDFVPFKDISVNMYHDLGIDIPDTLID